MTIRPGDRWRVFGGEAAVVLSLDLAHPGGCIFIPGHGRPLDIQFDGPPYFSGQTRISCLCIPLLRLFD